MSILNRRVIALHGDFAQPGHLEQDAGYPMFIDEYVTYYNRRKSDERMAAELAPALAIYKRLILVGYSRGGSIIGHLTHKLTNIAGAVLYESPLFGIDRVAGSFPALLIWNSNGAFHGKRPGAKRHQEALATIEAWVAGGRNVTHMVGQGKHTKWVHRPSTLWVGHGWDTKLNPAIGQWVSRVR